MKTIYAILFMILILSNTLVIACNIKPILAENSANDSFEENAIKKLNEVTVSRDSDVGHEMESKWDFYNTSGWNDIAYIDGNMTRLVVGVNNRGRSGLTELKEIAAKRQGVIVNTVSIKQEIRAVVVELPLVSVPNFTDAVQRAGLAKYVEPCLKYETMLVPNDEYWIWQWGPRKIGADWAWNTTVGDPSVLVAVVDTGIDYDHPDLAANYVALGCDWVNNDTDPMDDNGHGTHCAGIIAARLNNSIGVAGLAQARIMAEKSFDQDGNGYEDWVCNGVIHAVDQGAKIISMSWGTSEDSELIYEAIRYAYDANVLLVAAAGNIYPGHNMKIYPAAYDEVIAVAATDKYDDIAYFSNFGEWIELAAPGFNIFSTYWNDTYMYLSGTSMACPHVTGVAALILSRFPSASRDWVRLWLRYTADDLGEPGFDPYYGYGRLNAKNAIEQLPPEHELFASSLELPSYVELGGSAVINGSIFNFGANDETGVLVQLLANDTIVDSSLESVGRYHPKTVSYVWNPEKEGKYNVTLYIVPLANEMATENNAISRYMFVGRPVKVAVLESAGTYRPDVIINWQALNSNWFLFGNNLTQIDYTSLNKTDITYEEINATGADVLIIADAYDPMFGWEFTDSEIEAIKRYVFEGHGLIVTGGTFHYYLPNNIKLMPLLGLNETTTLDGDRTDILDVLEPTHPLFSGVPNPFVFQRVKTAFPRDGIWCYKDLAVGGKYVALGPSREAAIVVCNGLVYSSTCLERVPPYYRHHLQFFYNAIMWSRYQKPEHDLAVSIEAPALLTYGETAVLNATVFNLGKNDETNAMLQLLINGELVGSESLTLLSGSSYTLNYIWTPAVGTYNITAYAPPVSGEELTANNVAKRMVAVVTFTHIYVSPSTIAVNLGENFTVNAMVANVTHLYLWQITLQFDPNILECTNVSLPSDHVFKNEEFVAVEPFINNTGGFVVFGASLTSRVSGVDVLEGVLCQIQFRSIAFGSSSLEFSRPYGEDTFLAWPIEEPPFIDIMPYVVLTDGMVEVGNNLVHDVAVIDVSLPVTEAYAGWVFNVTVLVKNEGDFSETFHVTVYYNTTLIGTQTVFNLPPGEDATLTFKWNTTDVRLFGNYIIWANASNVPNEINTDNNLFTNGYLKIKLFGDVDNDGKVNMMDLGMACLAFASSAGHDRWNPDADVNHDGKIDLLDLALIAKNFGKTQA